MVFSMEKFLKRIRSNDFVLNCNMPLGYVSGYPIISEINNEAYLTIPYLKYKITGQEDMTLVYPIRYIIGFAVKPTGDTVELVSLVDEKKKKIMNKMLPGRFVKFEDLKYSNAFKTMEFDKPIGIFRHEAIKDLDKNSFKARRNELFKLYDVMINDRLDGREVSTSDKLTFKQLISKLLEPSLMMMYKMIDEAFYNKFLK